MISNNSLESEKMRLRNLILAELQSSGWIISNGNYSPPSINNKESIRKLHEAQRIERANQNKWIVEKYGSEFIQLFANGSEIKPQNFSPKLVQVKSNSKDSYLFRFATLLWSIPVSQGYGRRMRYLVFDESNDKLVGIFALGDPVFNLKKRDDHIGWDSDDRKERLYHVLDAYVLGAVPPYNRLLGGKFVSLVTISDEVRKDFGNKYRGKATQINNAVKEASLVLVTTTSALGRSSIYNRLRLPDEDSDTFRSVGYSGGWGHFHFSNSTFLELRKWLRKNNDPYADNHQYGQGPNWKMRAIRRSLELLDLNMDLLKHGLKREIFLAPLAMNYKEYLQGEIRRPRYYKNRSLNTISAFFKDRWMIPRSERIADWKSWTRNNTWDQVIKNGGWEDLIV